MYGSKIFFVLEIRILYHRYLQYLFIYLNITIFLYWFFISFHILYKLFTDLVGQTWNVYAVSALFGFRQDDIHFKLYSKRLREEIASTLSHEDVTYNANFSIMESIVPKSNHENHPAIKVNREI